jgi:hypothetical protein
MDHLTVATALEDATRWSFDGERRSSARAAFVLGR